MNEDPNRLAINIINRKVYSILLIVVLLYIGVLYYLYLIANPWYSFLSLLWTAGVIIFSMTFTMSSNEEIAVNQVLPSKGRSFLMFLFRRYILFSAILFATMVIYAWFHLLLLIVDIGISAIVIAMAFHYIVVWHTFRPFINEGKEGVELEDTSTL